MRKIYLAFVLLCLALTSQAQIRMTMVDPANHQIQIKNFGMMAVDISTYRLCALFDYPILNQAPVTISSGDFNLSPNESATITWDNTGGAGFLADSSDVGLYLPSGSFGSAANMVDFMQYGAGGQGRENVAVAGGRWTAGDFLETSSGPWMYTGDGTQNGIMFWASSQVVPGCMEMDACNYNPDATEDDGSCTYPGCTAIDACNFDEVAGCDDGSCQYFGCLDALACNYDSTAGCDDGTCVFPGCADTLACNFDATAGCDDGSCVFPGCTDSLACNYDASAGCDGGLCILPDGCTDEQACNYDSLATCDNGSCLMLDACGVCGGEGIAGCADELACNYDSLATCDNGTCTYPEHVFITCDGTCINDADQDGICDEFLSAGCADSTSCNYTPGDQDTSNDLCIYPGCTDTLACNYNPLAGCGDSSCIFAEPLYTCDGVCLNDLDQDGICDENEVAGCTDSLACNYDMNASDDDGSCNYPGCTEAAACNYDSLAICDDGSCLQVDDCGVCGGSGISGCMDMNACNYDMTATCDDNSCQLPDGCTDNTACNFNANAQCDDGSCTYPGCNDATACNYDMAAGCDDGSCTYTGTGTETLIMEHFDSYVAGDGVAAQSDLWDTWDGTATPDAVVVDSVSFSPSNSALISGQATDLVLPIGPYNTGRVITDFKMKLTDAGGYFNFLHNWANNNTNYQWACDVFFGGDGVVSATLGGADFTGNDVPVGEWFDVKVIADMYMDSGWVYINNELLGNWQWSLNNANGAAGNNQIAAIDFFGTNNASGEGVYYIDDVQVVYSTYLDCDGNCLNDADGDGICDELEVRVNEITAMGLPAVFPNPSNGVYQVVVNNHGVINQLEVLDLTGRIVYTDNPNRSNTVLDLTSLVAGNYILRITQDKSVNSVQIQKH